MLQTVTSIEDKQITVKGVVYSVPAAVVDYYETKLEACREKGRGYFRMWQEESKIRTWEEQTLANSSFQGNLARVIVGTHLVIQKGIENGAPIRGNKVLTLRKDVAAVSGCSEQTVSSMWKITDKNGLTEKEEIIERDKEQGTVKKLVYHAIPEHVYRDVASITLEKKHGGHRVARHRGCGGECIPNPATFHCLKCFNAHITRDDVLMEDEQEQNERLDDAPQTYLAQRIAALEEAGIQTVPCKHCSQVIPVNLDVCTFCGCAQQDCLDDEGGDVPNPAPAAEGAAEPPMETLEQHCSIDEPEPQEDEFGRPWSVGKRMGWTPMQKRWYAQRKKVSA